MEVCIRKEDVVLLSRKGCACPVRGRNTQVFGMLVFCCEVICLLVDDGSQDTGLPEHGGFLREDVGVPECVCLTEPCEGTFQFLPKKKAAK